MSAEKPSIPIPDVTESDANASGPHGLAGSMGVSSERTGHIPGSQREATHGAVDLFPSLPEDEHPPPEKTAGGSESHPDTNLPPHPFDRSTHHGHSHG